MMFWFIHAPILGLPEVKGFDLTALTQDDLQNLKVWLKNSWILKCTCVIKVLSTNKQHIRVFQNCVDNRVGLTRLDQQQNTRQFSFCWEELKTATWLLLKLNPKILVQNEKLLAWQENLLVLDGPEGTFFKHYI